MIDLSTREGEWFERLSLKLYERKVGRSGSRKWNRQLRNPTRVRPGIQVLQDYREGDPPLRPDIHTGWKPYILQYIRMGRLNHADLIVTATSNRLNLRGFRTAAANDELGDVAARELMRLNGLKVKARDVHDMSLTMGESYGLITPPTSKRPYSLITAEDPRQMYVATDPATGEEVAGLKMFRSEWDDEDLAYLYLPDGTVRVARRSGPTILTLSGSYRLDADSWTFDDKLTQETPGGLFPAVVFRNRDGVGEFERHLDTIDRINDKIFDEWWIAKIQAFRQRAVKNLPDTKDEVQSDGSVREVPVEADEYDGMFTASPDEMWQVPGDVDFWESTPVDMTPITNSIEKDRQRLCSVTQTSLPSMMPDAANGSAEGAALMREEHVFKCEDRRDRFDAGWAKVFSRAFAFQGDKERADLSKIEPMWAPIVRYSLSDMGSAAAQAATSLPLDVIRRDIWQYDPAEVQEMRTLDGRDLITSGGSSAGADGADGSANG